MTVLTKLVSIGLTFLALIVEEKLNKVCKTEMRAGMPLFLLIMFFMLLALCIASFVLPTYLFLLCIVLLFILTFLCFIAGRNAIKIKNKHRHIKHAKFKNINLKNINMFVCFSIFLLLLININSRLFFAVLLFSFIFLLAYKAFMR